ncbi:MAG: oxidoreductase [Patescibacteria group bacterium]|nr:MAG: oxidoreductase [Patescibacteria group bacterium]
MKKLPDFTNMHCLVVGASSGLGLEIVRELLKRGAKVVAASRNISNLLKIKNRYSGKRAKLFVIKTDITNSRQVDKLANFSIKALGNLNLLINTAGVAMYKPFLYLNDSEVKTVIDVNLTSAIMLIKKMLPVIIKAKDKKYVVQLGSLAGIKPGHKKFSVYSAAKEGLAGLFRSLAPEFEEQGVKFILVCPTGIKTNIAKNAIGAKELVKKFSESDLDNPKDVACGILDNLDSELVDGGIRLLPTTKSKQTYENL